MDPQVFQQATFSNPMPQYLNALTVAANKALADTGVTTIFIMNNAEANNKRVATRLRETVTSDTRTK